MNERGKIILIPTSGLANRLRITVLAMRLAKETGKELIIYWYKNLELQAEFKDLFVDFASIRVRNLPLKYKIWMKMRPVSSKLFGIEKWYLKLFNFDFVFLDNMAEDVWKNRLNLPEKVGKSKNVFICSCQEINHFNLMDYQLFEPVSIIQNKINTVAERFTSNTIGVHIRSTDNVHSIKNSPFHLFQEKIEEEILINPDVNFFLATDNEGYQNQLLLKFGRDKILFYKKEFSREKVQGIKDAVVDLFCLSKTSKIYGSYFSSFSEVAGRIGQIPVEVLKVN
jgi:hypothetical protein